MSYNKIGKTATKVTINGTSTEVKYHATVVVKFDENEIILNSGGWRTVTTKSRMNQTSNEFNLGFGVYQRKGDWFVDSKGCDEPIPFEDGMKLER